MGNYMSCVQLGSRASGENYASNVSFDSPALPDAIILEQYSKHANVSWGGNVGEWSAVEGGNDWLWAIWKLTPTTSLGDGTIQVTVEGVAGSVPIIKLMHSSGYDGTATPDVTADTSGPGGLTPGQLQALTGTTLPWTYQTCYFAITVGWGGPYSVSAKIIKIEWKPAGTEFIEIWNTAGLNFMSNVRLT